MKMGYSREKLMNLFLKGRKRVLSIGIILFTLIITLIIYRIQTKKIRELDVKKSAETKRNEVLKEIVQLEKTINLYKNIFSKKDAFLVMDTVSDIVKDSNVRLISIRPEKEERQPLYAKYPFTLVIGADNYHAIGKFISKIENSSDVYFVDAISIRSQEESQIPDKELTGVSKPTNKLIVNLILSIIAFKG